MAVAKPVRVFGALSIALFFFLVFTLVRQPPTIHKPGHEEGQIISKMGRDPLLDRTLSATISLILSATDPSFSNWRTTRTTVES